MNIFIFLFFLFETFSRTYIGPQIALHQYLFATAAIHPYRKCWIGSGFLSFGTALKHHYIHTLSLSAHPKELAFFFLLLPKDG